MKPVIKFTHRYLKLGVLGNRTDLKYTATLVACCPVKLEDLPAEFLKWDTDNGRFVLPKRGKYLLLVFHAVGGIFTTLRADWPPYKRKHYLSHVGHEFDVVMEGEPDPNIMLCHHSSNVAARDCEHCDLGQIPKR